MLGEIGLGGMGTVSGAVRDNDQYQKQVAIKLVRGGMDAEFAPRTIWPTRPGPWLCRGGRRATAPPPGGTT